MATSSRPRRAVSRRRTHGSAPSSARPSASTASSAEQPVGKIDGFIIFLYLAFAIGALAFIGAVYAVLNSGAA